MGYKTVLVYVFHSEKKGIKNEKAIEVKGKYKTFQKKGFCSIIKFKGTIPNIRKNRIPNPSKAKIPFIFFQNSLKFNENQANKTPIKIASIR